MALDLCQNFDSIQNTENKLMDFDDILRMQYYWPDLGENESYSVKLIIYRNLSPDVKIMFKSTKLCPLMSKSGSNLLSYVPWCRYFVCQISTELRPWSHADCSMECESIIHLYVTSCRNMCGNKDKHSGGVS